MRPPKFPPKAALYPTFAGCATVIHAWAIPSMLQGVPSLMMRLPPADVIGGIAYSLTFALFESLLVFFAVLMFGTLLPRRWMGTTLPVKGFLLTLISAFFALLALGIGETSGGLLLWLGGYITALGLTHLLIQRYGQIERAIGNLVERLTILATFYLFFDVLSVIIVIVRNLTP
jgi:hypothetical protein